MERASTRIQRITQQITVMTATNTVTATATATVTSTSPSPPFFSSLLFLPERLGHGRSSHVRLAQHRDTKQLYAVKCIVR